MEYKLIGDSGDISEPIETILENRGIENTKDFIKPKKKHTTHWSKLHNVQRAIDTIVYHAENDNNIFFQGDSDGDGYSSSALMINYLERVYPDINIYWDLHSGKQHGINLDLVPDNMSLVIAPDGGSNDFTQHKTLNEKGVDVVVIDHHEIERESDDAIVVNNQISPDFPSKQLTGAGMAYKVLQGLDEKLGLDYADDYLDLVAIGNIADSADLRDLETRYYVMQGLNNIQNSFLKALFKKQEYSTKGFVNILTVSFYINPLINAVIRMGKQEDKEQVFKCFLERDEQVYYKKKDKYESLLDNTVRMMSTTKNRQKRERDKGMEKIEERIEEKNLLDNQILIVDVTGMLDGNLSGLVANQVSSKKKRPTLLFRQNAETGLLEGSARGYEKGAIKDFKEFLTNSGYFEYAKGHGNAFGAGIKFNNIVKANEYFNDILKDEVIDENIHEVDFILTPKKMTNNFIKEISDHKDLWGGMVDEPLIAIKNIKVNWEDIHLIGKYKNTLKFEHKGIEYIKFFFKEDEFNEVFDDIGTYVMNVVGTASINEYKGNKTPQIVIEDFEITERKKKEIVF